ncbi:hypothetical protein KIW84_030460 [Lathyrus oleraceus]|uniref:Disease resistance N-terminal domain-containing protein n=1 Tax=Pisum sativum TaxID=3888 RepID=A0A9D4XPS0_PEA|nr:hypothetical protein KIW84_030460 [Pisum sativum]
MCSKEDVDAPLQSGIIRVFEQLGIEAPSDEDDFIEVRSKRQMINDRREQGEKEIKAKSRVAKLPQKTHSASQSTVTMANSSKGSISTGEVSAAADGHRMTKSDSSSGYNPNLLSQALPPIGTPTTKIDAQPDLRSQTNRSLHASLPSVSGRKSKNELRATLHTFQPVLDAAEEKRINTPSVKQWLDDLKDAVYDAEDLLNQISYDSLRCKMENTQAANKTNQDLEIWQLL